MARYRNVQTGRELDVLDDDAEAFKSSDGWEEVPEEGDLAGTYKPGPFDPADLFMPREDAGTLEASDEDDAENTEPVAPDQTPDSEPETNAESENS